MRTYIICTSPEGHAISNYFFLIARALVHRGDKVILILDKHYKVTTADKSLIIYSWPSKRPTKIKDFFFFYKICKSHKPDITLGQFGSTNIVLIVSWLLNIPNRLIYWHTMFKQMEYDSNKSKGHQVLLMFRKKFIIKYFATNVLTNSNATKLDLMERFNLNPNRILVLHYLIPDYFNKRVIPIKKERDLALSFVARLHKSKGHAMIIKQLPEVFAFYSKMKIYFIGDGPERHYLEHLCHELEIYEQVVFVGSVSLKKVYEHLGHTLIHISASIEEAFGLVNVEALSCGTPIMANKVGGIADIIQEGINGLFFNPEEKGSLFKGIRTILDSNWELYSIQARQSFLKAYKNSKENRTKQLELFDNLIHK